MLPVAASTSPPFPGEAWCPEQISASHHLEPSPLSCTTITIHIHDSSLQEWALALLSHSHWPWLWLWHLSTGAQLSISPLKRPKSPLREGKPGFPTEENRYFYQQQHWRGSRWKQSGRLGTAHLQPHLRRLWPILQIISWLGAASMGTENSPFLPRFLSCDEKLLLLTTPVFSIRE